MKKTTFIVAIILCLAIIPTVFCFTKAYAAEIGSGLKYTVDGSKLSITGSGTMTDFYSYYTSYDGEAPWSNRAGRITEITISSNVKNIGNYAFAGFYKLTKVTFSGNTNIGAFAFKDCTALESITIKGDVGESAFLNCSNLSNVTLTDTVTKIGDNAFEGTAISSISLPASLTELGARSFAFCYNLSDVTFGGTSIKTIGDGAFRNCYSLTSFSFPSAANITFGKDIFNFCESLTTVELNDCTKELGAGMFRNCTSLTAVSGTNGITKIGEYAFQDCTSLKSVSFPRAKTIDRFAFKNSGLTSFVLADGIELLDQGVFYGCKDLSTINYPTSLINISDSAFQGCSSLPETLTLNEGLISIEENAYNNSSVKTIYLPSTLAYVSSYAFSSDNDVSYSVYVKNSNTYLFDNAIGKNVNADTYVAYKNTSKVYASKNSHAYYYAKENGLSFTEQYSNTTPDVSLSSRLSGSANSKLYIGGIAIEDFDVIYQDLDCGDKKNTKNVSQTAKHFANTIFANYYGYTPSIVKLSEAKTSTKSHHIYIVHTNANLSNIENKPFATLKTETPSGCKYGKFTKYGSEGFEYIVANGNLYIYCGYQRGAMYAFDEIVEKWLGITFLYENITKKEVNGESSYVGDSVYTFDNKSYSINIPNGTHECVLPIFTDRGVREYSYDMSDSYDYTSMGASLGLRLNSLKPDTLEGNERSGYGVGYLGTAHSFVELLGIDNSVQPCFTDDYSITTAAKNAITKLTSSNCAEKWWAYENVSISVSQNDNPNYTAQDIAYANENGYNITDVINEFVNEVADQFKMGDGRENYKGSDAKVWTLAYMTGHIMSNKIFPRDNVQICYAWYGCQSHPIDSDDCSYSSFGTNNHNERENFEAWEKVTEDLYVWYYPVAYSFQMGPMPVLFNMLSDTRYFADHNVYGIYFENQYGSDSIGDGYSYELLSSYIQARCLTNPYMSTSQVYDLIREFIASYYSKDVDSVYSYLLMDEAASDAAGCWINQWDYPFDIFDEDYMRDNYVEMIALLDKAREKATTAQMPHIYKLMTHTLFLGLSASNETYNNSTDAAYRATYEKHYDRLVSYMKNYSIKLGWGDVESSKLKANYSVDPYTWYCYLDDRGNPTTYLGKQHSLNIAIKLSNKIANYTLETITADDLSALQDLQTQNDILFTDKYMYQHGRPHSYWFSDQINNVYLPLIDTNRATLTKLINALSCQHSTTIIKNYAKATCAVEGYTGDTYCEVCGKLMSHGETIPKTNDHTYENGECIVCKAEDPNYEPNNPLTNDTGSINITGKTGKAASMTIEQLDKNVVQSIIDSKLKNVVNFIAYDFTLFDKHNEIVQPSGAVEVSIDISSLIIEGEATYKVYHLLQDTNDLVDCNAILEDGKATFTTSSFSVYIVTVEKEPDPIIDPTTDPTSDPTTDPTTDPIVDPTTDPTTDPTSDPTTDPTTDPTVDPEKEPTNIGLIIGIIAGVAVIIIVVVIIIIKKKK